MAWKDDIKFVWSTSTRANRRKRKVEKAMAKKIEKNILQSKTSRAVAYATGGGIGTLAGLVLFIRMQWPGALPWPETMDEWAIGVFGAGLVPYLSRLWARIVQRK